MTVVSTRHPAHYDGASTPRGRPPHALRQSVYSSLSSIPAWPKGLASSRCAFAVDALLPRRHSILGVKQAPFPLPLILSNLHKTLDAKDDHTYPFSFTFMQVLDFLNLLSRHCSFLIIIFIANLLMVVLPPYIKNYGSFKFLRVIMLLNK
jgi:hypothetical protein